ncbi:MAG: hypothetical protein ACYCW6_04340 [Candidatus Xenobia bacterium]
MIVYIALLGLAFSAIYAVLIAGLKYFNTANATSDLENTCMATISQLERELAESDAQTVQVSTSPMGISFASPRGADDNIVPTSNSTLTSVEWQTFVCYYVDGQGNMVRKENPLSSPTTTLPTSQLSSNTPAVFKTLSLRTRFLGRNVKSFSFMESSGGGTPAAAAFPAAASQPGLDYVQVTLIAQQMDSAGTLVTDANGNAMNDVRIVPASAAAPAPTPVSVIIEN